MILLLFPTVATDHTIAFVLFCEFYIRSRTKTLHKFVPICVYFSAPIEYIISNISLSSRFKNNLYALKCVSQRRNNDYSCK